MAGESDSIEKEFNMSSQKQDNNPEENQPPEVTRSYPEEQALEHDPLLLRIPI